MPAERTAPAEAARSVELDAAGWALAVELKGVFPDTVLRYASEARGEPGNLGTPV